MPFEELKMIKNSLVQRWQISNIQKVKSWGKWLSYFFLWNEPNWKLQLKLTPAWIIFSFIIIESWECKIPAISDKKKKWVKNIRLWKTLTCKNMSRVWKSCFFNSSDFQWIRNAAHTYKWKWENPLTWRERTEKRLVLYAKLNFHLVS